MKIKFYVIRHGETLFNLKNRIQGICDSPLTEKGRKQTEKACEALKDVFFHRAFTSPSERCINTAQAILKDRNMEAEVVENLHEYDFGRFEGSRFTSHTEEIRYCFDRADFSSVNGDSVESASARVRTVFDEMLEKTNDGDNVLVVSHGYLEFFMMYALLGIDVKAYEQECQKQFKEPIPNAGIMVITYEDGTYGYECLPTAPDQYKESPAQKKLHFYYVRHGQTQFNVWNRMQGYSDSPLTEMGKGQAEKGQQYLANVNLASAFVSTTWRTRQTAAILLQGHNIPVRYTRGLKEVNFGEFEGIVTDSWREEIMDRHMHGENWTDVGGENFEQVKERMLHTLRKIISASKDGDSVLLVSHGTYYMVLLEVLFHLNRGEVIENAHKEGRPLFPNGGIFEFDYVNGDFHFDTFMQDPEDLVR